MISDNSSKVQSLLEDKNIKLFNFKRAKAYSKRFNYLKPLMLGEGMVDLGKNIPNTDITLLCTTATLVATKKLNQDLEKMINEMQ